MAMQAQAVIDHLRQQNRGFRHDINVLRVEIRELENEIANKDEQIRRLDAYIKRNRQTCDAANRLVNEYEQFRAENADLRNQMANLNAGRFVVNSAKPFKDLNAHQRMRARKRMDRLFTEALTVKNHGRCVIFNGNRCMYLKCGWMSTFVCVTCDSFTQALIVPVVEYSQTTGRM